jgi:hypothetical protein
MKTAKQRLFLMAATALALACSASEVSVLSSPFAPANAQPAVEVYEPLAHGSFDAWRAAAGYPPAAYAPQISWEAVFRAAPR